MATIDQTYNRRSLEKAFGYSQGVRAGEYFFLSGCVSWDREGNPLHPGDWAGQVRTIYEEIKWTLKDNGLDFNNVVRETIFCRDIEKLAAVNAERLKYFGFAAPPAATWVQVERLIHPDLLLEVEITAYLNR